MINNASAKVCALEFTVSTLMYKQTVCKLIIYIQLKVVLI